MMPSFRWKLRGLLAAVLILTPVVFLVGVGLYHLWATGWAFITYWPMATCFLTAYALGWYWSRQLRRAIPAADGEPLPVYWTDRDRTAWEIVVLRRAMRCWRRLRCMRTAMGDRLTTRWKRRWRQVPVRSCRLKL